MKKDNSKLVYSSEIGRVKEEKKESEKIINDGFLHVRRETKGRNGGTVIVISNIPTAVNTKELVSALKKRCGSGGTIKNSKIEIQGDNREKIKEELESRGFKVKFTGG